MADDRKTKNMTQISRQSAISSEQHARLAKPNS